jgi:quercetin dioxygenase-like cupin family protein
MSASVEADPLLIKNGEARPNGHYKFLGLEVLVKVSAQDTGGEYCLVESVSPPFSGPPLHSHVYEELFQVTEGEFLFELGGQQMTAGPGDVVRIPGGAPHVFQNIGAGTGRMLVLVRPAGIEDYFADLHALGVQPGAGIAEFRAAAERNGVTLLGPPIAARQG